MKMEIYWTNGKSNKELLSKKFYKELEKEIDFLDDNGLVNEVNILNGLKNHIDSYNKTENQQYLNNITNSVKSWNSRMKKMYNSPYSAQRARGYIEKGIIKNGSALYMNLAQPNISYNLSNDQDILAYCQIVSSENFNIEEIAGYKELINNQYQELEELRSNIELKAQEIFKTTEQKIDNTKKVYEELHNKSKEEIQILSDNYNDKIKEHESGIERVESKYEEKLKIDGPVKFWEMKSEEYKKISRNWLVATGVVTVVLLFSIIFLGCLLFDISYVSEAITITFKGLNKNITVGNIIIIAAVESVILYAMRVSIKYYDYYVKLYEFYKSKTMLASFIVEIKDEDNVDQNLINMIYMEIFKMREVTGEEVPTSGLISSALNNKK